MVLTLKNESQGFQGRFRFFLFFRAKARRRENEEVSKIPQGDENRPAENSPLRPQARPRGGLPGMTLGRRRLPGDRALHGLRAKFFKEARSLSVTILLMKYLDRSRFLNSDEVELSAYVELVQLGHHVESEIESELEPAIPIVPRPRNRIDSPNDLNDLLRVLAITEQSKTDMQNLARKQGNQIAFVEKFALLTEDEAYKVRREYSDAAQDIVDKPKQMFYFLKNMRLRKHRAAKSAAHPESPTRN